MRRADRAYATQDPVLQPSYRALVTLPGVGRLVASMLLARLAGQMVSLVLVLFALGSYGSAAVAGAVTFLAIAPGLVTSPIAGALLDRHGRTRLVVLDYAFSAVVLALIAALALLDTLPVPVLLVLVTVNSLTFPLSNVGVRTLFPTLVPPPLWERANALDSNGYVVASIFGPAIAGALVATAGAPAALLGIAVVFGVAAVVALGLHDPGARTDRGPVLVDALAGLVYVVRHPTLRTLAVSVSLANVGWGTFFIALPVLVLRRFGADETFVGLLFALTGVAGSISVLLVGRVSTLGREYILLALAMLGEAAAFVVALAGSGDPRLVALAMIALGIANGPFDVALFTVRQRRTDPEWMGRAFAVSMALNFAGFPIGSALAGFIVPLSIEGALLLAVAATAAGGIVSYVGVPHEDRRESVAQVKSS